MLVQGRGMDGRGRPGTGEDDWEQVRIVGDWCGQHE